MSRKVVAIGCLIWSVVMSSLTWGAGGTCPLSKCRAATAINDCQPGELCRGGDKAGGRCPGDCVSPP